MTSAEIPLRKLRQDLIAKSVVVVFDDQPVRPQRARRFSQVDARSLMGDGMEQNRNFWIEYPAAQRVIETSTHLKRFVLLRMIGKEFFRKGCARHRQGQIGRFSSQSLP